jgi:ribose transport system substrate-binding protein
MIKMRFNVAAIFAGAAILAVVGCGSSGDNGTTGGATATTTGAAGTAGTTGATANTGEKKYKIAVIPKGATHEYWKAIHAGANAAADELGNVEIIWKAPEKEDAKDEQIGIVENLVNEKVSGIVLAPLDVSALTRPVNEAIAAGIPVVVIDSGINDAPKISSYVATNNFKGGQMAGEELGRLLGGKGKVVMIRYEEGSASTMERENGWLDAMKKFPGIKIVSDNQYAGATPESAQKTGENVLGGLKKPDGSLDIDGLYCPNESSTFGLLRVLQDNKWAGKIKFVGFDSSAKLVDGLRAGEINGLIIQNPFKMGHDGVKAMFDVLEKKTVDAKEDTGATLVTKENMDKPDIAKLLAPPSA